MKLFLMLLMSVFLHGCSLLNTFYDDREVFESSRDSEIGKTLEWVIKYSSRYYYYNIENEKRGTFSRQYKMTDRNQSLIQYEFDHGSTCKWFLLVNRETGKIESWEYASRENDCGYKRFYEGPF